MDILDYESTVRPEWWLKQIGDCDWAGARYLYTLLTENRFHELCGEKARLLLLTDGTKLVSFCTYAEKDDIPDTELTPWMGFVYTRPDYRGRRLIGRLIPRVKKMARDDGYDALWISTGETGLYEKYGAEYVTDMTDARGGNSRIYRMDAYGFYGWKDADVKARTDGYPGIETPKDLYRALWKVWTRETCTARISAIGSCRRFSIPLTAKPSEAIPPNFMWARPTCAPADACTTNARTAAKRTPSGCGPPLSCRSCRGRFRLTGSCCLTAPSRIRCRSRLWKASATTATSSC